MKFKIGDIVKFSKDLFYTLTHLEVGVQFKVVAILGYASYKIKVINNTIHCGTFTVRSNVIIPAKTRSVNYIWSGKV